MSDETEARAIAQAKAAEIAALTWEELDAYGKRVETATGRSGHIFRVKSRAYWDMEEWASGLDIKVKVYAPTGLRRIWPYVAWATRGSLEDPIPKPPS